MNDKEKLISFINKGKENKPVKEVHVIKDSPTEAHILLVNEDGTNVASNRFEIMDAHDLMTLIENPSGSGLDIELSRDNKKVRVEINNRNDIVEVAFGDTYIEEDERWPNLSRLINYLSDLSNADTRFYLRKSNLSGDDIDNSKVKFDDLIYYFPLLMIEGYINGHSFLFRLLNESGSVFSIIWQNEAPFFTSTSYPSILTEYNAYKGVNGLLYINLYV